MVFRTSNLPRGVGNHERLQKRNSRKNSGRSSMSNNRVKKAKQVMDVKGEEPKPARVEVVRGNTDVLMVQLLAEAVKLLKEIRDVGQK